MDETLIRINLDLLHESPFNPRRTFQETGLRELAVDIAQVDVHTPLTVRRRFPNPLFPEYDPQDGYEIVFGHRRSRAAKIARDELAGKPDVLCRVRELTDEQAKRLQLSENLQREDVHPIEEAEGFDALMRDHGVSADELAEQTGKSRSYVYGRLKLLQACKQIRDACLAGDIGSEVALLIARLRTDKLQEKALGYIKGKFIDLEDGGSDSCRAVQRLLNERFTLELDKAMFDPADDTLVPLAGACTTCPKRSGNAPEFSDVANPDMSKGKHGYRRHELAHEGEDVCTDPDCFDAKKRAHLKRAADAMTASGKVVVDGNKARQAIDAQGNVKGAYIALKDVKAEVARIKKERKTLAGLPVVIETVTIQDPRTGKTVEAVKREDLKASGGKVTEPKLSGNAQWERQRQIDKERRDADIEKAKAETKVRLAILDRTLAAMVGQPRTTVEMLWIAQAAFAGCDYGSSNALAERHGLKSSAELKKVLGQWTPDRLALFAIESVLIDQAMVDHYELKSKKAENLLHAAEHYGVDAEAVRAELQSPAQPASTPSTAARAKKKAKAAPAKKSAKAAPAAKKAKRGPLVLGDPAAPDDAGLAAEEQTDDAGVAGGSIGQRDLVAEPR